MLAVDTTAKQFLDAEPAKYETWEDMGEDFFSHLSDGAEARLGEILDALVDMIGDNYSCRSATIEDTACV